MHAEAPPSAPQTDAEERRFRTFVLGAGFSVAAGLPLANALWASVLTRVDARYGADNQVRRDLDRFVAFKRATTDPAYDPAGVDFEEFMGFLDIEHFLGLQGSDTWSDAGNKTQLIVRWLIGQVLFERQAEGRGQRPAAYRRFAERLRGGDYVLTFNYDTLIEESLEAVGRSYRLFPTRFREIGQDYNEVDTSRDEEEVVVLKLHGSLDWFDAAAYERSVESLEESARAVDDPRTAAAYRNYRHPHPVFGPHRVVESIPLVDGPRSPSDPLRTIHRVRDPAPLYERAPHVNPLLGASPVLLAPSYQKLVYAPTFAEFWNGLGRSGGSTLGMGVIGFSLPKHDEYVLQALYSLARNYTDSWYDSDFGGLRKLPLRLVDYQTSPEGRAAYEERYRFLNWERTETCYDGFGDAAVDFLFRESRA